MWTDDHRISWRKSLDPQDGTRAGRRFRWRRFECHYLMGDHRCRNEKNGGSRNQRHVKWPSRRITRRGTDRSVVLMPLTTGMSRRHHRRSTFLRHLHAAVAFCLGHLPDWDHTGDRRRCSPKDRDCQHRQRTRSRHTHILQVPIFCKHAAQRAFFL